MPPHEVVENEIEGLKTFRREEILKSQNAIHQKNLPWYLIIDDKVYDVKDFVSDHPGGSVILTRLGLDATDAFNNFHPSSTHGLLANYYVGDVAFEDTNSAKDQKMGEFAKEIREIRDLFKKLKYFESSKLYYSFKLLGNMAIWSSSVMMLYMFGNSLVGVLVAATLMALFWQQCGWLAHDFLHHQIFDNRHYNNLMGCFVGSVCQGFDPSWWKDKHNTHHAAPNVHGQDPDIDTHPLLSWSEYALTDLFDPKFAKENAKILPPWLVHLMVNYQTISYFPILCVARISWCIQSILFAFRDSPSNQLYKQISTVRRISLAFHYIWFSSILFLIDNWFLRFIFIVSTQAICGLLLALVFSLNHNGMKILSEEESSKTDFFVEQVITARDIIASNHANQWIVDWFCGGLGYQIEHHIFPSMPRHNFHKIQPIIQTLCEKYKIPYHKTTFLEGTKEVFGALGSVSHVASKKY